MNRLRELALGGIVIGLVAIGGCNVDLSELTDEAPEAADSAKPSQPLPVVRRKSGDERQTAKPVTTSPTPIIRKGFLSEESAAAQASRIGGLTHEGAVKQIGDGIREAMQLAPTLVVWMFDQSDSAFELSTDVQTDVTKLYEQLAADQAAGKSAPDKLLTAVISFGGNVEFLLEEPSSDPAAVLHALDSFRRDTTGKEMTFAAVQAALEKYLAFRTDQRREVLFVVVTDESGDDGALVDELLPTLEKSALPVYVIGVPAPFGRLAGIKPTTQDPAIHQGPESRDLERIRLGFWSDPYGLDLLDSGFGPFDLERLCRGSGGRFLALRPDVSEGRAYGAFGNQWPSVDTLRFEPQVMNRYTPDYISRADYQKLLDGNAACRALHNAAQFASSDVLAYPPVEFVKRSEAEFVRDLGQAQQGAARLEPVIDNFYQTLLSGETDRGKITSPRWQAGYDLAMGRVAAAKARIDGYNAMLAELKRGKNFEKASSDRWILEPADSTDAGSAIKKLAESAREYLTRVISEHPGTPWATIAARELETPLGWKWTEQ